MFFDSRPLGVLRRNRRGIAAKLDFSFPQAMGRMIRQSLAYFIDARFLAAGTGVEYEDFHVWAGSGLLRFLAIPGSNRPTKREDRRRIRGWPGIQTLSGSGTVAQ